MTDFKEFFMYCDECMKVTRWAFMQMVDGVEGECEECEAKETFESWDEVIAQSEDD